MSGRITGNSNHLPFLDRSDVFLEGRVEGSGYCQALILSLKNSGLYFITEKAVV